MKEYPLPKAPPGYVVTDVNRRIDTLPLRGRIFSWLLYKTPLRALALRVIGPSPYVEIVATIVREDLVKPSSRTTQEKVLIPEDGDDTTDEETTDAQQ